MKKTETTVSYTCDICNKPFDGEQQSRRIVFGFDPVEPYGIDLIGVPFGVYRQHVCERCFIRALKLLEEIRETENHD